MCALLRVFVWRKQVVRKRCEDAGTMKILTQIVTMLCLDSRGVSKCRSAIGAPNWLLLRRITLSRLRQVYLLSLRCLEMSFDPILQSKSAFWQALFLVENLLSVSFTSEVLRVVCVKLVVRAIDTWKLNKSLKSRASHLVRGSLNFAAYEGFFTSSP
jgi:hypothetical protein